MAVLLLLILNVIGTVLAQDTCSGLDTLITNRTPQNTGDCTRNDGCNQITCSRPLTPTTTTTTTYTLDYCSSSTARLNILIQTGDTIDANENITSTRTFSVGNDPQPPEFMVTFQPKDSNVTLGVMVTEGGSTTSNTLFQNTVIPYPAVCAPDQREQPSATHPIINVNASKRSTEFPSSMDMTTPSKLPKTTAGLATVLSCSIVGGILVLVGSLCIIIIIIWLKSHSKVQVINSQMNTNNAPKNNEEDYDYTDIETVIKDNGSMVLEIDKNEAYRVKGHNLDDVNMESNVAYGTTGLQSSTLTNPDEYAVDMASNVSYGILKKSAEVDENEDDYY